MTRIGKYLTVRELPGRAGAKTKRWGVYSRFDALLGIIAWHTGWRQYTLQVGGSDHVSVWSDGCLSDVAVFLNIANRVHRGEFKNERSTGAIKG